MNPYQELANAIVVQAAEDYRKALRQLRRNPGYSEALRTKEEAERFFRSKWYTALTSVDGEWLITVLRKEAA